MQSALVVHDQSAFPTNLATTPNSVNLGKSSLLQSAESKSADRSPEVTLHPSKSSLQHITPDCDRDTMALNVRILGPLRSSRHWLQCRNTTYVAPYFCHSSALLFFVPET